MAHFADKLHVEKAARNGTGSLSARMLFGETLTTNL
jgi:hypothetical protein